MSELVKIPLEFRVVDGAAVGVRDRCDFLYSPRRPLEIRLWFVGLGQPWVICRDLLADGLNLPSGDGDVFIEPVLAGHWVDEHLSSPTGKATLRFNRDDLLDALDATWQVCERGAEHIDVDAELASLLKGQAT